MLTVHTTPEEAQLHALYALGIFTVTDLGRHADKHRVCPSHLLTLAG